MFDKLKNLPQTISNWYNKKKDEDLIYKSNEVTKQSEVTPFKIYDTTQYSVFNPTTKNLSVPVSNVFQEKQETRDIFGVKPKTTPNYSVGNFIKDVATTDPMFLAREQGETIKNVMKDTIYSYAAIPAVNFGEFLTDIVGWEEMSNRLADYGTAMNKDYIANKEIIKSYVGDDEDLQRVVEMTLQVKDALGSMATFGLNPKVVAYGIPFLQEFSTKYSEVKQVTGNKKKATAVALTNATFSTLTEYLFSGSKYLEALEGWGKKPLSNLITTNLSEILQENLQQLGNNLIDKYTYDRARNIFEGLIETTQVTSLATTIASLALKGDNAIFRTQQSIQRRIEAIKKSDKENFDKATKNIMSLTGVSQQEAETQLGSLLLGEGLILDRIQNQLEKFRAIKEKTGGKKPAFAGVSPEINNEYQKLKQEAEQDLKNKILQDKEYESIKNLMEKNAGITTPTQETAPLEATTEPSRAITETTDLTQEARKYKSAEEFIKATQELSGRVDKGSTPTLLFAEKRGSTFEDLYKVSPERLKGLTGFEKPPKTVTVYRGVKDPSFDIKIGDYVTTDKNYAKQYGNNIKSMEVPASELRYMWGSFKGNQLGEFPEYVYYKTKSQLTDIWNKAQGKPTIKGKVTGIQEKPTKVSKAKIDKTIKPMSEKITKGISYLNKLRYRLESTAANRSLIEATKLKNQLIRDLRAEGFSIKEIASKFRKILRADTPSKMELARSEVITDLQEQKEVLAEKKMEQKLTDEKRKLIGDIRKLVKKARQQKLMTENKELVNELLSSISVRGISEKNLITLKENMTSRLETQYDYMGQEVPADLIETIKNIKPLKDLSNEELAELKIALSRIIATDRVVKNLIIGDRQVERGKIKETAIEQLNKKKDILDERDYKSTIKTKLAIGFNAFKNWFPNLSYNPATHTTALFNSPEGKERFDLIKKLALGEEIDIKYIPSLIFTDFALKAEDRHTDLRNTFVKKITDIGFSEKDSFLLSDNPTITKIKLENGSEIKLTNLEKIYIAGQARNEDMRRHILSENGGLATIQNIREFYNKKAKPNYKIYKITETDLKNIINSLDKSQLEKIDKLFAITAEQAVLANEVSIRSQGFSVAEQKNYMRAKIITQSKDKFITNEESTTQDMNIFNQKQHKSLTENLFKRRTKTGSGALLVQDALSNILHYNNDLIKYVSFYEYFRDTKMFLKDIKDIMIKKPNGNMRYQALEKFVVQWQDKYYDSDPISRLSRKGLQNLRSAIMKANFSMSLMQPVSAFMASINVGEANMTRAMAEMSNPFLFRKLQKELIKNSPQAYDRLVNRNFNFDKTEFLSDLDMVSPKNQVKKILTGLDNLMYKPVTMPDSYTVTAIYRAYKLKAKQENPNLSETEIQRIAANAWNREMWETQPSSHYSARSEIGRSPNVFIKGLTMFTGVSNKARNVVSRSIINFAGEPEKNIGRLIRVLLAYVMSFGIARAIQRGIVRKVFRNENTTPKQFIMDSTFSALFGAQYFGEITSSLLSKLEKGTYSGWEYEPFPYTVVNSSIDAAVLTKQWFDKKDSNEKYKSGINKGKKKKDVMLGNLIKSVFPLGEATTGMPFSNISRITEAFKAHGVWRDGVSTGTSSGGLYKMPAGTGGLFKAPKSGGGLFKAPR